MVRAAGLIVVLSLAAFCQPPAFEAASVKPNKSGERRTHGVRTVPQRLSGINVTLRQLLLYAYPVPLYALDGPGWMDTERFDVQATTEKSADVAQMRSMLGALLADRFHLQSHRETREISVYRLAVAKNGPKLHDVKEQVEFEKSGISPVKPGVTFMMMTGGLSDFAQSLSAALGRPVLDRTGIEGRYFFHLEWAGDGPDAVPGPALPTALQEQFGLKLESGRAPIEMLVIDHVERPAEN